MAIIKPIKEIEVTDFRDFCKEFKINTNYVAGDDGTDEELIESELKKVCKEKWLLNFIDDSRDGYFRIQQIQ